MKNDRYLGDGISDEVKSGIICNYMTLVEVMTIGNNELIERLLQTNPTQHQADLLKVWSDANVELIKAASQHIAEMLKSGGGGGMH